MNPTEIEFAVRDLVAKPYDPETLPYELIGIFNASKMTISRLKSGTMNKAKQPGDVLWQKKLFFRPAKPGDDVGAIGDALVDDPLTAKHKPRFILVTNGQHVHVRDLTFSETENIEYERLDEKSDFLLPLAGFERRAVFDEHPADKHAAKKLKKLYDALLAANPTWSSGHHTHELNLLMTRLLFCFYAEDTGIFETPQIFTSTVTQHTAEDGSNLATLLGRLFHVMNVQEATRHKTTLAVDGKFPYVNGSLFEDTVEIPQFNRTARRQLIECGDLDWTTINPDIFGSMIQTIAQDSARSSLGMHYTSRSNIMKVLEPLFIDSITEDFDKGHDSVSKLEALLRRLATIRVFDPACGSGNFLIMAYKELRKLEMRTLSRISEISPKNPLRLSGISLNNFYGLDIVDFASETAKLSLWIAEYQMNSAFKDLFGIARPVLPLGRISTINCGNSLRLDWLTICPRIEGSETYLCGNPPYAGDSKQTAEQKLDTTSVFLPITNAYKSIDYVGCFFLKAAMYLNATAGLAAFVSTNSICQGEQVAALWPLIYRQNIEIKFAYQSFKWQNNAANNAGVTCIIVGLGLSNIKYTKTVYAGDHKLHAAIIGPYLTPGTNLIVKKAARPLNGLPDITWGNKPTDEGNLLLSPSERTDMLSRYPECLSLIRRFVGSDDFINHIERYCLWIDDESLDLAMSIPQIKKRIAAVRSMRLASTKKPTQDSAATPHRFQEIRNSDRPAMIIPEYSSERRQYLQIGMLEPRDIASNKLYLVYDAPPFLFAVLSSRLHRLWTLTVGGKLETRPAYSSKLVYNTFPLPTLSNEQKRVLAEQTRAILRARANHPGKTIAWLYNPETMPQDLLKAHLENDEYLEACVYGRTFEDDTQRLARLFSMYAAMSTRDNPALLGGARKEAV